MHSTQLTSGHYYEQHRCIHIGIHTEMLVSVKILRSYHTKIGCIAWLPNAVINVVVCDKHLGHFYALLLRAARPFIATCGLRISAITSCCLSLMSLHSFSDSQKLAVFVIWQTNI